MFPGEFHASGTSNSEYRHLGKESLPALHCRIMLLWCSSLRMHHKALNSLYGSTEISDEVQSEQATSAVQVWLEIAAIEKALARHHCHQDPFSKHASLNWICGRVVCVLMSHLAVDLMCT